MTHSAKRVFAKRMIKIFRISKVVMKLNSVAVEIFFSNLSRQRIDELRNLMPLSIGKKLKLKRYGSNSDGGYLLHDDILRTDICISLGVGNDFSFDFDLSNECEKVLMFDHTINEPLITKSNIKFERIGISDVKSKDFTTIDEILKQLPDKNDLILKIDIEGSEWKVLSDLSQTSLLRFRQIIAEFHNLHRIADDKLFSDMRSALEKLNKSHDLINIHANNWSAFQIIEGIPVPDVIEVLYLRRDSISSENSVITTLNYLGNMPNNPDLSDFSLSFISILKFREPFSNHFKGIFK